MCGIAGILGDAEPQRIGRMVSAMRHRGPDDTGTWTGSGVSLGHARLSIMDCTSAGHQPMLDAVGMRCIAFNGEIYNFREIRAQLEGLGHQFRTRTDTEVILAAHAQWGIAAVSRFRGMFAFALVDSSGPSPVVWLVRDRLGIKPLLYSRQGTRIVFASELRALLASGLVAANVDEAALLDYVSFGAVLQPRTILTGVQALPPGHFAEIRSGWMRVVRYWDLVESTRGLREQLADISADEAREAVSSLLTEATRYHVIADVPVGSFLSGGIDSAVVTGLMGEVTDHPVSSFSIGFDAQDEVFDERSSARRTADRLGTHHHEREVGTAAVAELFDSFLADIDQPSADGFNTWLVSRYARQHLPVALSGLGGDELFAGYPHFSTLAQVGVPLHPAVTDGIRWLAGAAYAWLPRGPLFRAMFRTSDLLGRFALLRRLLHDVEILRALHWNRAASFAKHAQGSMEDWVFWDGDHVQRVSYWEVRGYLLSTLLRDADAMSMAHGLELRPVLLDHVLVEFVFSLPERMKVGGTGPKPLLVNSARRFVPESSINATKRGFNLPMRTWMLEGLRDRIEGTMQSAALREIFRDSYLDRLRSQIRTGNIPTELWAWMVLAAWLERNRIAL